MPPSLHRQTVIKNNEKGFKIYKVFIVIAFPYFMIICRTVIFLYQYRIFILKSLLGNADMMTGISRALWAVDGWALGYSSCASFGWKL